MITQDGTVGVVKEWWSWSGSCSPARKAVAWTAGRGGRMAEGGVGV
jgi:hypothetical protein